MKHLYAFLFAISGFLGSRAAHASQPIGILPLGRYTAETSYFAGNQFVVEQWGSEFLVKGKLRYGAYGVPFEAVVHHDQSNQFSGNGDVIANYEGTVCRFPGGLTLLLYQDHALAKVFMPDSIPSEISGDDCKYSQFPSHWQYITSPFFHQALVGESVKLDHLDKAIPVKSPEGAVIEIPVTQAGVVEHLNLRVKGTFPRMDQLTIKLTHPDGTTVVLLAHGDGEARSLNAVFSFSLRHFANKALNGTWKLTVSNPKSDLTGNVDAVELVYLVK